MALTPEEVVNKRFSQTKFREGYDQDEVDDFLDEVVVELRRLIQENEELRAQLANSGSAPTEAIVTPEPVSAPVVPTPAPVPAPALTGEDETESTTNLLQLARRLHDEHVQEGVDKRDELIAEGHAQAARIIAEAEAKQRTELAKLNQEKAGIEHRIDELRQFEKDYRVKLRSYIEGQLRDLGASDPDVSRSVQPTSLQGLGG